MTIWQVRAFKPLYKMYIQWAINVYITSNMNTYIYLCCRISFSNLHYCCHSGKLSEKLLYIHIYTMTYFYVCSFIKWNTYICKKKKKKSKIYKTKSKRMINILQTVQDTSMDKKKEEKGKKGNNIYEVQHPNSLL